MANLSGCEYTCESEDMNCLWMKVMTSFKWIRYDKGRDAFHGTSYQTVWLTAVFIWMAHCLKRFCQKMVILLRKFYLGEFFIVFSPLLVPKANSKNWEGILSKVSTHDDHESSMYTQKGKSRQRKNSKVRINIIYDNYH